MTQRVGYIGLGVMGFPMARRLAAAGHRVVAYDADPATLARAGTLDGFEAAGGPADVAGRVEVLFTCLPNPRAVEEVYGGLRGDGLLACDCSTITPMLARRLHAALRARGVRYVEAPVLGGQVQAERGELYAVVSGEAADIEPLVPLLGVIGRGHKVVGGPGEASRMKTVQNGLGLAQVVAIAEALGVLAKAGADLRTFYEVVVEGHGMADTPLFRTRALSMLGDDGGRMGRLRIGAKDIGLACELAAELGAEVPLFRDANAVFAEAMAMGLAEEDLPEVARVVERRLGVDLKRR